MVDTAPDRVTVPGVSSGTTADRSGPAGGEDGGGTAARRVPLPLAGTRRVGGGGGRWRREPGPAGGRIDLRNTWQVLAGSILVPLGVVFILMAWYGAAHTSYVQQQIPYLVSGSFAGVGCLILGGLLYWAHWLYRIYDQADMHHQEQLQVLQQTLRAMSERTGPADRPTPEAAAGSGAGTDGPPAVSGYLPAAGTGQRPSPPSFVVTPTGSVYHLPTCPVVAHHREGLRSVSPGQVADLVACRICLPNAG